MRQHIRSLEVNGKKPIKLKHYKTNSMGGYKSEKSAKAALVRWTKEIGKLQEMLHAQRTYGLLILVHGADTAGKSTLTKHLMRTINVAGCHVASFKAPTSFELSCDYLRRHMDHLPKRGEIGVFDRSYYEELVAVKVHPEFLAKQRIPSDALSKDIWKMRYKHVRHFEEYLDDNGFVVLKFYLHLSKQEQKKRILKRLDLPEKNHKYSINDIEERKFYAEHEQAMQDAINNTSTRHAPCYILPADNKWVTRALAAEIVVRKLRSLKLFFPVMAKSEHRKNLRIFRKSLLNSKDKDKKKKKKK